MKNLLIKNKFSFLKGYFKSSLLIHNLKLIIPYLFLLSLPIFYSYFGRQISTSENYLNVYHKKISEYFFSDKVQNHGSSVSAKSFSRRQSALLKIKLLSLIPASDKEIVLFSNHQLQYLTKNLKSKSIFNMWMGNYTITEIADLLYFLEKESPSSLPNKLLLTSITSPNNDNLGAVFGYSNELPLKIQYYSDNPYVNRKSKTLFNLGSLFESSLLAREMVHYSDFKFLWGFLKNFFSKKLNNIYLSNDSSITGVFSFDSTGSSTGYQGVDNRPLIFNESSKSLNILKRDISFKNINEILYSLKSIDSLAKRNDLIHILIIPPLHESDSPVRKNTLANRILDRAIFKFKKVAKSSIIIDDRYDPELLGKSNHSFFYHYDHPSPKYGDRIYKEIQDLKLLNFK